MFARLAFLSVVFVAPPALAQLDPLDPTAAPARDPLDPAAGGALVDDGEQSGLLERKKKQQNLLADPDQKRAAALEERRGALEKRINALQSPAGKFARSEEAMNKLTGQMLKGFEKFFPEHTKLLGAYRSAVSDNRAEKQKAIAKQVAKLRDQLDKLLDTLEKGADKVDALIVELDAKVKAEEAEDAEERGGDE